MKLNKEEMLMVLAEIAVNVEAELNYCTNTVDTNFRLLSLCEDISSYDVNKLYGRTSDYISDVIEKKLGYMAVDNDEIQIIFRITRISDNELGYIRFSGRYNSWDSSDYYSCEVVYPRKIETTVYETKLELKN